MSKVLVGLLRLCCVGLGLLPAVSAWAEDCRLKDYGTMPVEVVGSRATTMVKINGISTRFIIDTGAFFNTMSSANAASLGLKLQPAPFGFRLSGIGGSASVQQAHVKAFGILGTTLDNVDFIVGGTDAGTGLLGANLLDLADLEMDLSHGKLTLFKAEHCDNASLAYWAKDGKYNVADIVASENPFDRRTFFDVTINGRKVRAVLDSGAPATVLSRDAAERSGINLAATGIEAGGVSIGIGAKPVKTWMVHVDSFSVGSETIQNSQVLVIDGRIGDRTDMLLGLDFLLAHRMFIANSKKKAYFSYNGGRVFAFAAATGDTAGPDAGSAAGEGTASPKTAGDYALSGQAHLSRGETRAALADLDEAIRLAPSQAAYYVARASAREANQQPDAALADLDKSLNMEAGNLDALLMRAHFRFARKDREGALADASAASALAAAGSAQTRTLAALYIELDQPASALPLLDNWIRLHGNDAMLGSALNERCWARGLSNQMLDDALKDCRRAIQRDGDQPTYLDSLGLIELRLARYGDAIKAYEQALVLEPRSAWSRYGLGLAKVRSGQIAAGNADLASARALDPRIESRAAKLGLSASTP
ncbi:MAG TPA: aspartyl protease family protein [Dyella sp.]|uniref:aspartyl protease family protein n=1 Tax=Dyella sp. TaxID=1869338 RepID=UPI002D771C05|nr:aspartyl protease family protein [Dyella sp.]HET6553564.1 aspartyl protease family protein [Dyella sp.]